MITAMNFPLETLDDGERAVVANVRDYGWFRNGVLGDAEGAEFSYTTGFWLGLGYPEIIVFGLSGQVAHNVFWGIWTDIKDGRAPPQEQVTSEIFSGKSACLIPVDGRHYAEYLGWNRWFYNGDDFPCLQLVWPDRADLFPWQAGAGAEFAGIQPDLSIGGWRHLAN